MRTLLVALSLTAAIASCRWFTPAGDEPPADPARLHLFHRLNDARAEARASVMRELAPAATRFEVYAIARAAKDQPEAVRVAAAESLGMAPPAECVDLLGALLHDPSDEVRAVAVTALAKRQGEKAPAYIAGAYAKGGPKTRVAVARAGGALLARAVEREAADAMRRVESVLQSERRAKMNPVREEEELRSPPPNAQRKGDALMELARMKGAEAAERIAKQLSSDEPLLAAAAVRALAEAGAVDKAAELLPLVAHPQPAVAEAAIEALVRMERAPEPEVLVKAIERGDGPLTHAALQALGDTALEGALAERVCRQAAKTQEVALSIELFRHGPCGPAAEIPADPEAASRHWLVLAAVERIPPGLLPHARAALVDRDARIASSAATFLARHGEPLDAVRLADAARGELTVLNGSFDAKRPAVVTTSADSHARDRLAELLASRRPASEALVNEPRPGSLALIAASAAGAASLGGDVTAIVEALLASPQTRLRALAVDVADLAQKGGEGVREKVRASTGASIRIGMALRDVAAGREGAVDRLMALAQECEEELSVDVAKALRPAGASAKTALVALAGSDGEAAAVALEGLRGVEGEDVAWLFADRAGSSRPEVARAAVRGLASLPSGGESTLLAAALHPSATVREAALSALADRKACAEAGLLSPLSGDADFKVRRAAQRLKTACPPAE